jgi:hypothetical protein
MVSVYSGRACLGFIIARGRGGFEAFDRDEQSLGFFPTNVAAADAVLRSAPVVEAHSNHDR